MPFNEIMLFVAGGAAAAAAAYLMGSVCFARFF